MEGVQGKVGMHWANAAIVLKFNGRRLCLVLKWIESRIIPIMSPRQMSQSMAQHTVCAMRLVHCILSRSVPISEWQSTRYIKTNLMLKLTSF